MIRVPIARSAPCFDVLAQSVFLPWPPTVNTYWRTVTRVRKGRQWVNLERPRHLISARGRDYREIAILKARQAQLRAYERAEPVIARLIWYLPDQRRRDLDNLPKAVLDALQAAGVLADDHQIARTFHVRVPPGVAPAGVRVDLARLI